MRIKQKSARGYAEVSTANSRLDLNTLEIVFEDEETKSEVRLSLVDVQAANAALESAKEKLAQQKRDLENAAQKLGV